jgi:multidrug transporter EmrE-like cation transporter
VNRNIRNRLQIIYDTLRLRCKRIRRKYGDFAKIAIAFAAGIVFILIIQFLLQDSVKQLEQPIVGSILAIAGIFATVAVGIAIFLMQKEADSKINQIIVTQEKQHRLRKIYFSKEIIRNLNEIKEILETIKKIAQDFPAKRSDHAALRDAIGFIVLKNMAIQNRLIPGIEECNRILLDHYNDLSLYEVLFTVERFGGPSAVIVQQEQKTKNLFETELYITTAISAVDFHLEEIRGLIPRIQKEIPS